MAKINLQYFIARRLAVTKESDKKGVMVTIASLSVAISMVVMIVALSVIFGFKREIYNKLEGFVSTIQITNLEAINAYDASYIPKKLKFTEDVGKLKTVKSISPYAIAAGIVKGENAIQGVTLKGVDPDFDFSFFYNHLIEGELPRFDDSIRNRDVLISEALAKVVELKVGDRFEMLFMQSKPRRERFKVAGIYNTGLEELDKITLITDIRNVQKINGWSENQVTGFDVMGVSGVDRNELFNNVFDVVAHRTEANNINFSVADIEDRYQMLYDWLATHDINAAIVITIMLLVSVFNMAAAMLVILLQKSRMIGVLKALGMRNRNIQQIFVIRSSYIIVKSFLWGNVIGILICLIQKYFHVVKLDSAGYFLSHVPILLDLKAILILNFGAFAVILLLLMLPTMIVSRIAPEKVIRFE